jgi:mannose-6-phosphate isomerase-like protein (cupin superfamily)
MKRALILLTAAMCATTLFASEPTKVPGFTLNKVAELEKLDAELAKTLGPNGDSRMTVEEYGDHRLRMLRRDGNHPVQANGAPETHADEIDVIIVQSGEGTLVLGGEMKGGVLQGGERHALAPGDVAHVPAKVQHAFVPAKGKHLTYILLKIPAVYPPSASAPPPAR